MSDTVTPSASPYRIGITGIGAVSAVGPDVPAFGEALKTPGRVFVPNNRFDLDFEVVVGLARPDWFAPSDHPELESPTGNLCLAAAGECVTQARRRGGAPPDGLIVGTSTGGQSCSEAVMFSLLDGTPPPEYDYKAQGCIAGPSRLLARQLEIVGPVHTVSTACTSSANAIALGAMWIRSGRCRRVLAGGGDALCHTTITSFHALELTGSKMCTPFAPDRPGLTLGEGAGFLMLERLDDVLADGRKPLAHFLGAGMSSDAHHMTAPPKDGNGAVLAMERALEAAGLTTEDVAHINAHGTGTRLNDDAEARAIHHLFGDRLPVTSCKGLIGHTLGGAGGLEAVATVLSLVEGRTFESLGTTSIDAECPIAVVPPGGTTLEGASVILSNSFAFGGNNCTLVFRGLGKNR